MSNCVFTITIKAITPLEKIKVSTEPFLFKIKNDLGEGEIRFSERKNENYTCGINGILRDVRFTFMLFNIDTDSLLGLSDIVIPISTIQNYSSGQNFLIEKILPLSIIDSCKRQVYGTIIGIKPLNLCVKIETKIIQGKIPKALNQSYSTNKKPSNDFGKTPLSPNFGKSNKNYKLLDGEVDKNMSYSVVDNPYSNNSRRGGIYTTYTESNMSKPSKSSNKQSKPGLKKTRSSANTLNKGSTSKRDKPKKTLELKDKDFGTNTLVSFDSKRGKSSQSQRGKSSQKSKLGDRFSDSSKRNINNPIMSTIERETINSIDLEGSSYEQGYEDEGDREETEFSQTLERRINSAENEIEKLYKKIKHGKEINHPISLRGGEIRPRTSLIQNSSGPNKIDNMKENIGKLYSLILNYELLNKEGLQEVLSKQKNLNDKYKESSENFKLEFKKYQKAKELKTYLERKQIINVKSKTSSNFSMSKVMDNIKNNEMKLNQIIFNKPYNENDIQNFSEINTKEEESNLEKLNLLKKCINLIIKQHGAVCNFIPNITQVEYINIRNVLGKMDIKEGDFTGYLNRDEPPAKITEEDEDKEEEEEERGDGNLIKRTTNQRIKSNNPKSERGKNGGDEEKSTKEQFEDLIIEDALKQATSEQKITFKKVDNKSHYIYGTIGLHVRIEGKTILIRTANNKEYTIEQFLNENKVIEETKRFGIKSKKQ